MLIVFEGIDGCGKGTQIELLKKELGGTLEIFKYPTNKTPELNEFLEKKKEFDQREVFHLFLKDIMNEQDEVREKLKAGIVVLDRYVLSTAAYEKDGISSSEAKKIISGMGFLKPDLVILMDMDPKVSQERKRKQKSLDRYEADVKYLENVRKNFLELAKERFLTPNWHIIDASQSVSVVHQKIMDVVKSELSRFRC
ncbi:MAG: dTMP kinase [Candidatus Micrarchaeia archaeon]|jgi:dTMP kinase